MQHLLIDAIERDLEATPMGDVVYLWNKYMKGSSFGYTPVSDNLSNLAREHYADRPEDLAKGMYYGCVRDPNSYVFIESDGGIYSLDDVTMLRLRFLAVHLWLSGNVSLDITIESEGISPSFYVEFTGYTNKSNDLLELFREQLDYESEVMGVSFGEETFDPTNWNMDIVVNYIF